MFFSSVDCAVGMARAVFRPSSTARRTLSGGREDVQLSLWSGTSMRCVSKSGARSPAQAVLYPLRPRLVLVITVGIEFVAARPRPCAPEVARGPTRRVGRAWRRARLAPAGRSSLVGGSARRRRATTGLSGARPRACCRRVLLSRARCGRCRYLSRR